jgi:tetratricopeptide (TPR) repeat protein
MQRPLHNALMLMILASLCLAGPIIWAETGILVLHVKDVHWHPVAGLEIGVEGDGGTDKTDAKGKARIKLAAQSKEKSLVSLQIVKSPAGQDLVMVSPWDYRTLVPSFENETDNFVEVVVVQSGDRSALENGSVLAALTAKINKANAPNTTNSKGSPQDPKANLEAVAKQYGLTSKDLDAAIREWGTKTIDPYEAGLAALYARNYNKATSDLQDSLKQREEKLAADQKGVADAAFFLGSSLYGQGKYRESAAAYKRCLQIRAGDPAVLNNTALSLLEAGDYTEAEQFFRRALATWQNTLGSQHPYVALALNNLAVVIEEEGDYAKAEQIFRQALAMRQKVLPPDDPGLAASLDGLASVLEAEGEYAAAEPLYRQALAIETKAFGPDSLSAAYSMEALGNVLEDEDKYPEAEKLLRQALAIETKALGPEHPSVGEMLNDLADVLSDEENYAEAEAKYRQSLEIKTKTLGPEHPYVAQNLNDLGELLADQGKSVEAELFYRKALAIRTKVLSPEHPDLAQTLNDLADLYAERHDDADAEPLYLQALAIREKALPPDNEDTMETVGDLAALLQRKGDDAGAKALYQRHPAALQMQKELHSLHKKSAR